MTSTYFSTFINPLITCNNDTELINFFRQKRILKSEMECLGCGVLMRQVKKKTSVDKHSFRCFTTSCCNYKKYRSIRAGSFLEHYNFKLSNFLHFLYLFSLEISAKHILELIGMSESLVFKLHSHSRFKMKSYFETNPIVLGGPNIIIQIDESKFNFNVKSHRGHAPNTPIWVFGLVDTSFRPSKGYMQIVNDRTKETLLAIIEQKVCPGSIIHSDEWPAYRNIQDCGFEHGTVCHKFNFVNPLNNVHTQHVESYWNRQKLRIKKLKGVKKTILPVVLVEFMYRDWFDENLFQELLNLIKF